MEEPINKKQKPRFRRNVSIEQQFYDLIVESGTKGIVLNVNPDDKYLGNVRYFRCAKISSI